MFTPKRNSTLSTAGSNSARVTRSQSLKGSNEFMSPGAGSGFNTSGSLAQRLPLSMSPIYNDTILESFKAPLPIKVNELIFNLKSSQELGQIVATILTNGHVCLIHERKLYIWRLKKSIKNVQCNELALPASRSPLKQNCVSVECHNNKDYVCICVTSEGIVRYWPSVFNEYLCVDAKIDIQQSDEVSQLVYIAENSYVAVTGNGNAFSISIEIVDGKITPICKQIDTSNNLLTSVGRRMTSFIFGGISNATNGIKSFKAAVRYKNSAEFYLLVDKNLQRWKINNDNSVLMSSQINVDKLFYDQYTDLHPESIRASVWFQDCSITKNSIYILGMINDETPRLVIGEIDIFDQTKLRSFHELNYSVTDVNTHFKFHALDNQHAFYLYNSNTVISFTGPTLDSIEESKFNTLGDRIIASNTCEGALIFLSLNHGILKAKDSLLKLSIDEESFSGMNQSIDQSSLSFRGNSSQYLTFYNQHDLSNLSMQNLEDVSFGFRSSLGRTQPAQSLDFTFSHLGGSEQINLTRLKEAFQCFLRKEERESQDLVDELIQSNLLEKKIDFICVELSEKIIDDMPAHDPRWAELSNKSRSFNTNVIITNQLKGKQRMHEYFVSFLQKFGIWERLTVLPYNGRDIETKQAIEEHGEKLNMAINIREVLYKKNPELINLAIELTIKSRDEKNTKNIYSHDLFYRRVSKIDDIFNSLYMIENDVIKNNSNEQAINYLIDTTSFFNKLLKGAQLYRKEKARLYEPTGNTRSFIELIRWTFLPLNDLTHSHPSILNIFIKQHKLCSEYGLTNCNTVENKSIIFNSLFELDQLIFDEYELRLKLLETMVHENDTSYQNFKLNYDSLKSKLIEVYIKYKQIDMAVKLAEQYVDFNSLVTICELKNDLNLLESFLDKFVHSKFAEYVVRYFMERKKLHFLLNNQFLSRPDVSRCLDRYQFLSWIKDFKNNQFLEASQNLSNMGHNENDSFLKKRTLLSLSKLSLYAEQGESSNPDQFAALKRELNYLNYIEHLAPSIQETYGLHHNQIPAYKAEKLIEVYINETNATEIEFKKAFELIAYLKEDKSLIYSPDQIKHLKREILVRSILADNWEQLYDLDYPESKLYETKFVKTLFLLKQDNEDLQQLFEMKDSFLTHDLLVHLSANKKFNYLLQASFELL